MKIVRHVNRLFSSNTYVLFFDDQKDIWVIDPGDFDFIDTWWKIRRTSDTDSGKFRTAFRFSSDSESGKFRTLSGV